MSPIRYLRRLVAPTGRHRAVAGPSRLPLGDLLGPWPPAGERPHGSPVTQAWQDCPPCDKATAGVRHRDGSWTCGECFETTVPEGAS